MGSEPASMGHKKSEDSQITVPDAFVDLFRPPGADRS